MTNINDLAKKIEETVEVELAKNTIVISGKTYKIKPLKWEDGIDLWEFILKKLLPSIGSGFDRLQHDDVVDGSPTTFTQACLHLSRNLDGNTFKLISMTLFDGATVDNKPLDLNEEFTANYNAWRKLLVFALKENFSSFFEEGWTQGLTSLTAMLTPMMSQESE